MSSSRRQNSKRFAFSAIWSGSKLFGTTQCPRCKFHRNATCAADARLRLPISCIKGLSGTFSKGLMSLASDFVRHFIPRQQCGIAIQCYARVCVCMCIYGIMWIAGGVRVAFALKVVETLLAIPIPSLFEGFPLVEPMNPELATDPDSYHIPILVRFLSKTIILN